MNDKIRQTLRKWRKTRDVALVAGSPLALLFAVACHQSAAETPGMIDSGNPKAAAERIAEADRLYGRREDINQARLALTTLREARMQDYGNYEANWKLARAAYYVGDHTTDERERDNAFREGTEAGKAAISLENARPEGHFWLGANYGGEAEHSSLANYSSFNDIRNEMEAVLKIDEGFQRGSAYLGLGQLYLQAPRLLGGDHQKAIEYLEKGLRFGSDNAVLRLRLAEAYHAAGRDQDASKQINFIIAMTPSQDYEVECKEAVVEARKLRGELKG